MSTSKRIFSDNPEIVSIKRSKLIVDEGRNLLERSMNNFLNDSFQNDFESSLIASPGFDEAKRRRISLKNINRKSGFTNFEAKEKSNKSDKSDNCKEICERRPLAADPIEFNNNLKSLNDIISKKFDPKKAFSYDFINIMDTFISNKGNEGNIDFKLIGLSLEAGTKVYTSKVDVVYKNTQKVSSSLSMATEDQKCFADDDGEGLFDDDNFNTSSEKKNKRRKQKKNINTIVSNIDSFNGKLETNIEIDPLFHHLSAAFDVGNANSLLMANLNVNPHGVMLLDSDASLDFASIKIVMTSMTFPFDYERVKKAFVGEKFICKPFRNFEFLRRDVEIQDETCTKPTQESNFYFDLNADVEDINEPTNDFDFADPFNHSNTSCCDEMPFENDCNKLDEVSNQLKISFESENLMGILPDENDDNQFFNKNFLRRVFKKIPRYHNSKGTAINLYNKKTKARKERPSYKENVNKVANVCEDLFNTKDKNSQSIISRRTFNNEDLRRFLMLDDCTEFSSRSLRMSCARKDRLFNEFRSDSNKNIADIDDNSNAANFANNDYSDNEDVRLDDDDFNPNHDAPAFDLDMPTDKIDDEPVHIDAIDIDYAKDSKKVDIKKIKKSMWDIIKDSDDANTVSSQISGSSSQSIPLTFSNLRQTLPKYLSTTLIENLSTPISFVALLHLCNERTLALEPQNRLSNFIIQTQA